MDVEKLKEALKWALKNGVCDVSYDNHRSLSDAGCGCCSGNIEVPEELKDTIFEVLGWT